MRKLLATVVGISLAACTPVQQVSRVAQPVGVPVTAGIGDPVLTVNLEKSLPNAFGNADVFGRTTPTGIVTVQYAGISGDMVRFVRSGVQIETGATTMNSTPLVVPNVREATTTGYVGSVPVTGSTTVYGPPTVIQPNQPAPQVLPQAQIEFVVDLSKSNTFVAVGKTVTILTASATSITYRID